MTFVGGGGYNIGFPYFYAYNRHESMILSTSCSRVSDRINCHECNGSNIVKNGRTKTGKQQYYCKSCGKRFITSYSHNGYQRHLNCKIIQLTKEG